MLLLLLSLWSLSYGVFYPFVCYFMIFVFSCCAPHWGGVLTFSGVWPTRCVPLSICMCRYIGGFFGAPIFSFLYMLLDTVLPPIYACLPSILVSPPRFSTVTGLRKSLSWLPTYMGIYLQWVTWLGGQPTWLHVPPSKWRHPCRLSKRKENERQRKKENKIMQKKSSTKKYVEYGKQKSNEKKPQNWRT